MGKKDELQQSYICPICIKKGWRRHIEVDIIGVDTDELGKESLTWRWKCTYARCPASDDWQLQLEPVLEKSKTPKIGEEVK